MKTAILIFLIAFCALATFFQMDIAYADPVYSIEILITYQPYLGIRTRLEGSQQPYNFTLTGCLGTLKKDGERVTATWDLTSDANVTLNADFAPIDSRKDVVSVDAVNNIAFTLKKEKWFGLWSPFGENGTSYDTIVHWVTDNGPNQYRDIGVTTSFGNGWPAEVQIFYGAEGGNPIVLATVTSVTVSNGMSENLWGQFEVTKDDPLVPEPATIISGLLGLAGFAVRRFRKA